MGDEVVVEPLEVFRRDLAVAAPPDRVFGQRINDRMLVFGGATGVGTGFRAQRTALHDRLFDLNSEANRVRKQQSSAIITADVRRFGHVINKDEVFGTHSGVLVSSYGPVATLSIFCADQALAPEFQPRRRGHSPLLTTPKTSSPALRAGLFLLRNSQSVILGSSDRAKDLLPIYVFPQLLPRPSLSGAFSFAKSHARPPLCCNP
jgi:hypothetical protein